MRIFSSGRGVSPSPAADSGQQTAASRQQPADSSQRTADRQSGRMLDQRTGRAAKSWICPPGTWPVSKDASGALPISSQFPVFVGLRPAPLPGNISNRCGTWAV